MPEPANNRIEILAKALVAATKASLGAGLAFGSLAGCSNPQVIDNSQTQTRSTPASPLPSSTATSKPKPTPSSTASPAQWNNQGTLQFTMIPSATYEPVENGSFVVLDWAVTPTLGSAQQLTLTALQDNIPFGTRAQASDGKDVLVAEPDVSWTIRAVDLPSVICSIVVPKGYSAAFVQDFVCTNPAGFSTGTGAVTFRATFKAAAPNDGIPHLEAHAGVSN